MRLLLVEDDRQLAQGLRDQLSRSGYAVDLAFNAEDGAFMGAEEPYDLVILDLGLPDGSGLEILREWRKRGVAVPVLVLTAWDAWHERVAGFKAGCDDYLGKPFHFEELLARLQALLRRAKAQPQGNLSVDGISLDEERQQVRNREGSIHNLTGTEFRLLRYFMLHPDRILSKSRLTEHVYEYDEDKDSNVIEVYIMRLRQLVGKDRIETRRGQGYLFRGGA
ncbi:MAG: response regulator transcription factor [Magnetococcales bacterium]|nr:response regulator transcription factor [Magnetococcales bacterium]